MIDVEKQIAYWRNGSAEDWDAARELVKSGRTRHGLFFAHLALEKMVKAHVCRVTGDLAPRVHNLVHLAELAGLSLSETQRTFLARFNQYQLEGRYPDTLTAPPTVGEAERELEEAEAMLQWFNSQF